MLYCPSLLLPHSTALLSPLPCCAAPNCYCCPTLLPLCCFPNLLTSSTAPLSPLPFSVTPLYCPSPLLPHSTTLLSPLPCCAAPNCYCCPTLLPLCCFPNLLTSSAAPLSPLLCSVTPLYCPSPLLPHSTALPSPLPCFCCPTSASACSATPLYSPAPWPLSLPGRQEGDGGARSLQPGCRQSSQEEAVFTYFVETASGAQSADNRTMTRWPPSPAAEPGQLSPVRDVRSRLTLGLWTTVSGSPKNLGTFRFFLLVPPPSHPVFRAGVCDGQ